MDSLKVADLLRERFPGAVRAVSAFRGETTVTVSEEWLRQVMTFLKEDGAARYDLLVDLAGVDQGGNPPRLAVVYLLHSLEFNNRLRVKVPLAGESLDTVSDIWMAANWLEREAYDMFGITFRNHPDLRRILLEEDFEGHPLRKEFPLPGRVADGQGGENG